MTNIDQPFDIQASIKIATKYDDYKMLKTWVVFIFLFGIIKLIDYLTRFYSPLILNEQQYAKVSFLFGKYFGYSGLILILSMIGFIIYTFVKSRSLNYEQGIFRAKPNTYFLLVFIIFLFFPRIVYFIVNLFLRQSMINVPDPDYESIIRILYIITHLEMAINLLIASYFLNHAIKSEKFQDLTIFSTILFVFSILLLFLGYLFPISSLIGVEEIQIRFFGPLDMSGNRTWVYYTITDFLNTYVLYGLECILIFTHAFIIKSKTRKLLMVKEGALDDL